MAEMSDSNLDKITIVQQAIASCCGAIITSLFVTPLDVIKTRLQAPNNPFPKAFHLENVLYTPTALWIIYVFVRMGTGKPGVKKNGHFKGSLDAFVKIIQIEGIKSLWSGLSPTLIMALPTTVIYFTCYDQLSKALKSGLGKDAEHIPVLAGPLSRFGSVTVVSPLELIRTRMQCHNVSYKQLYTRVSSKVGAIGWFSLWRGWSSTVLRDVPFSAMYWYNYECFKKMMCKELGAHEPTLFIAFTSGAASGSKVCTSTWAVMRKIVTKNGITGLFAAREKKERKEKEMKKEMVIVLQ